MDETFAKFDDHITEKSSNLQMFDDLITQKASFVAQLVKNLPVMWETWIRSLG